MLLWNIEVDSHITVSNKHSDSWNQLWLQWQWIKKSWAVALHTKQCTWPQHQERWWRTKQKSLVWFNATTRHHTSIFTNKCLLSISVFLTAYKARKSNLIVFNQCMIPRKPTFMKRRPVIFSRLHYSKAENPKKLRRCSSHIALDWCPCKGGCQSLTAPKCLEFVNIKFQLQGLALIT